MNASVLHVIAGLGAGGAERMLCQLATARQGCGFRQHVVSIGSRGRYADELESHGVSVTTLGADSVISAIGGLVTLVRNLGRLSPTVIQGWMYHGNIFAALAHRATPRTTPRALLWNLRASNMDEKRYGRLIRWNACLSSWPDIIIANSESGAAFHQAQGFRARRMVVIDNGIDSESFRPDRAERCAVRAELGIPNNTSVVIHGGRLDPMKDHQTFLTAMAKLPSVTGLMVGSGTDRLSVPPNVMALGLRKDMPRLYTAADIVVSTSAFGEGFSNAIAEGMSTGLVPIATDVGDVRRIVADTGRIVAPADPSALAAAIAQECASPEELRAKGLRARARIVDNFSVAQFLDAFVRLYQSV